jgi:hypothetical protein
MGLPMPPMWVSLIAGLVVIVAGCQAETQVASLTGSSVMPPLLIPRDVQRIAVLYPKSASPDMADAYNRLEGATFQLKAHRPALKIVDRFHLPIVLEEHRLQLTGAVADDSAIRIGRVLGVDSVLIYRIDGPSNRDRMWARSSRDLPPVTVTSKVIRVESAEVLYHRVVVARIEDIPSWGWSLTDNVDYQRLSRDAIERGIMQTVSELGRALE